VWTATALNWNKSLTHIKHLAARAVGLEGLVPTKSQSSLSSQWVPVLFLLIHFCYDSKTCSHYTKVCDRTYLIVLSGMIFLPAKKLSNIVQCEHNLRWMTWYQPSLSCFRFYLLSGITVYIPYNLTVCLFQMPMNAPRQPSVTWSMATVPIPLVPIFVPAKLVSLEMVGTVLVRWIQIRFCKNNHISCMHLTWTEKH